MPFRTALLNLAITFMLLMVVVLVGVIMRERRPAPHPGLKIPMAGIPGYRRSDEGGVPRPIVEKFQILRSPTLVESSANEADTLRIRYGSEEYVFVLYYVDALETSMNHPQKVAEQGRWFQVSQKDIVDTGRDAALYVSQLLKDNYFNVLTRWERVPNTIRYYALIKVQLAQGPVDLADLLIQHGYARVGSLMTELPNDRRDQASYLAELKTLDQKARQAKSGIWSRSLNLDASPGTEARRK
jgi:endonuclease YncB( thermonuclease family)